MLLLFVITHCLCGCDARPRSATPRHTYRFESFAETQPAGAPWKKITIDHETRQALTLRPGQTVSFSGRVPPDCGLAFAFGSTGSGKSFLNSSRCLLVEMRAGSGDPVQLSYDGQVNQWRDENLDLRPFAGRNVTVTFSVDRKFWQVGGAISLSWPYVVGGTAGSAHKNVILISLDTLRADHMGCYGYSRATTPALDEFSQKGFVFSNCISTAPWTLPSHVSLFTALYPSSHTVIDDGFFSVPPTTATAIPSSVITLPEIIRAHGYETRAVTSHIYVSDMFGFGRGFNVFHNKLEQNAEEVTARALSWIERLRRRPFFLFLHYFDCHDPYSAPGEFNNMFDPDYEGAIDGSLLVNYINAPMPARDLQHLMALYDGEIRYLDTSLGRLLQGVEQAGLMQNTMIVITADHGEEFKDHGSLYHGCTLFDEMVRVPLLLYLPGEVPAAKAITAQISSVDIMPTILGFLDIDAPPGIEGQSAMSCLTGNACEPRAAYSSTSRFSPLKISVRTNALKYILSDDFSGGRPSLYDLVKDPGEQTDIAQRGAQSAAKMDALLFANRSIRRREQLCLRIVLPLGKIPFTGRITTSGRFVELDTLGVWPFWPTKTINLNASRNELVIDFPEEEVAQRRGELQAGVNLRVEPPDAQIRFDDWAIDGQPTAIHLFSMREPAGANLSGMSYRDLMDMLELDPEGLPPAGKRLFLFKTSAMVPRKILPGAESHKQHNITDEDRARLKALGYIQ